MTISDFANLTLAEQFEQFHELGIPVALHHTLGTDAEWWVSLWGDNTIAGTGGSPAEAFADAYLGVEPHNRKEKPCIASS